MKRNIQDIFDSWNTGDAFSGVFSVTGPDGVVFERACGYRNIAEKLPNKLDTAFAIASGTKFFTALSICKLVDDGKLSLESRIWDLLPYDLMSINKDVTVFHLITHTSGIGDYIDEEASDDYNDILSLYDSRPVHKWDSLEFYLPMFREIPAKFKPGERVGYSNAGFILLGLVIEAVSGKTYHQYVAENIIGPLSLSHTGFYRMNALPENTALGYTPDPVTGELLTNVLYMPVIGGSDGGLFTCAEDMVKLWRAVVSDKLLSSAMRERFFTLSSGDGSKFDTSFGLGCYLRNAGEKKVFYTVGGDFGTAFFSAYFPGNGIIASALGNTEMNAYPLLKRMFEEIG